jgi:hypothetical protein
MPKKCLREYAQVFCFVLFCFMFVCVGQNLIGVAFSKYGAWYKPITILGLLRRGVGYECGSKLNTEHG